MTPRSLEHKIIEYNKAGDTQEAAPQKAPIRMRS